MAEIFHFTAMAKANAAENLDLFIRCCRSELTVFGADLNWDDWFWPKAGTFTKLGCLRSRRGEGAELDDQFIEFAKAYFRYQQGHKPTGSKNELQALRVIEKALLQSENCASLGNISISTFDLAAQLSRDYYSKGAAYSCGRELERLANFLSKKILVEPDLSGWKNSIQKPSPINRTGLKAKLQREKKLPSEDVLTAFAEIFANNPSDPKDIFTSAVFAILICAPSRITEVLELPVDCEVEKEDEEGNLCYGWRFHSGKGYGANIKWIPTEMVDLAKEAIRRIKNITEESRKLAKWIEKDTGKFYRHANCPLVDENEPLLIKQVCNALGYGYAKDKTSPARLRGVGLEGNNGVYTLSSLWTFLLSRQPEGFPWVSEERRVKYSNALFCMSRNFLHAQRGTSPVILWTPTHNIFNDDLQTRKRCKFYSRSIFDRFAYKDKNGNSLKLTSHQTRHLLNTIAQRGGLSQWHIAQWSGRAELAQNRVYNHMSEFEMVVRAGELDTSLSLFGPAGEVGKFLPITIQEFNTLEKGPIHRTEFGGCRHDWTMSPCDKFRDCTNCCEHLYIKGDEESLARLKEFYDEVKKNYLAAKQATDDGSAGADRWYEHHEITLKRLDELISIMEDPSVPNGARVGLRNDKAFSPLRRALESTRQKRPSSEQAKELADMKKLLGGGLG